MIQPNAITAERAVLSAMMQAPAELIPEAQNQLCTESFYSPNCQAIFGGLLEFADVNDSFDLVMFTNWAQDKGKVEGMGGISNIAEVFTTSPSASQFDHYAAILKKQRVLRNLLHTTSEATKSLGEAGAEPDKLLDEIESQIQQVRSDYEDGNSTVLNQVESLIELANNLEELSLIHI